MFKTKTQKYRALIYLIIVIAIVIGLILYLNFANPINYYRYQFQNPFINISKELNLTQSDIELNNTQTLNELNILPTNINNIENLGINLTQKQKSSLLRYGSLVIESNLDSNNYFKTIEESNLPILLNNNILISIFNLKSEILIKNINTYLDSLCINISNQLINEFGEKLNIFTNDIYKEKLNKTLDILKNNECSNLFNTATYLDNKYNLISLIFLIDSIRGSKLENSVNNYISLSSVVNNNEYINFEILDQYIKENINDNKLIDYLDKIRVEDISYTNLNSPLSFVKKYKEYNYINLTESLNNKIKDELDVNNKNSLLNLLAKYTTLELNIYNEDLSLSELSSSDLNLSINLDLEYLNRYSIFINYLDQYLDFLDLKSDVELEAVKKSIDDLKSDISNLNNSEYYINYYNQYKNIVSNTSFKNHFYYIQVKDDNTITLSPLLTIDFKSLDDIVLKIMSNIKTLTSVDLDLTYLTDIKVSDKNFNEGYDYSPIPQWGGVRVPILMYHQIANPPSGYSSQYYVSPDVFENQIAYLLKKNYKTINDVELLQLLENGSNPAQKSVMLTFDDGNYNNYSVAYPILKKYGFTGIFGIVSNSRAIPDNNLLEMSNNGISIQSHSATHRKFKDLTSDEVYSEAINSKYVIESITGSNVSLLVYPYCIASGKDANAVSNAGYSIGLSCGGQIDLYYSQRYVLPRVQIYNGLESFKKALSGILN